MQMFFRSEQEAHQLEVTEKCFAESHNDCQLLELCNSREGKYSLRCSPGCCIKGSISRKHVGFLTTFVQDTGEIQKKTGSRKRVVKLS